MILIRPFAAKDSARLSQIINQVCADTPWMLSKMFVPTNSWIHAIKMDVCQRHQLIIAESDGQLIGWCRSFPVACGTPATRAELGIGLIAKYRNRGIGSELVIRSIEWAKMVGLENVYLLVSPQNRIAAHVFEKCGFQTSEARDNELLMSICLS